MYITLIVLPWFVIIKNQGPDPFLKKLDEVSKKPEPKVATLSSSFIKKIYKHVLQSSSGDSLTRK